VLLEERIVEHVARIFHDGHGADEWHARAARDLLPPGTRCPKCGGTGFRKETDILDVWFDSGCSHAAVLETRPELRWPAELYLEGSDQHRGWFHSSLLEAMGTRGAPPYKAVLTCGFVVDGEGRKMSKSLGNGVEPEELLPKYGAEVLRLWVAAEDYTEDIRLSTEILDRLADAYRRMRNTFRFLLGNLYDFDPARDRQSYARLDEVDRWVLDRLARLIDRVRRACAARRRPRISRVFWAASASSCRRCSSSRASTSSPARAARACTTRARTSRGWSSASTARRATSASGAGRAVRKSGATRPIPRCARGACGSSPARDDARPPARRGHRRGGSGQQDRRARAPRTRPSRRARRRLALADTRTAPRRTRRPAPGRRRRRPACSRGGARRRSDVRPSSPRTSSVGAPRVALLGGAGRAQRRGDGVGVAGGRRAPGEVGVMRG